MDHDVFDVFLQRKKHAFESVRAFISDAFRSRLFSFDRYVFVFFSISIGYDRPRAGS